MNDKEFDRCKREMKRILNDKYGKYKKDTIIEILQWAFREGYKFAKDEKEVRK